MTERDLNKKHKIRLGSECYYCVCRVCNMLKCRYATHFEHCLVCVRMNNTAVLDCDGFESRYYRKIFRIKKEVLRSKRKTARQMIEEIYKSGKWK